MTHNNRQYDRSGQAIWPSDQKLQSWGNGEGRQAYYQGRLPTFLLNTVYDLAAARGYVSALRESSDK